MNVKWMLNECGYRLSGSLDALSDLFCYNILVQAIIVYLQLAALERRC